MQFTCSTISATMMFSGLRLVASAPPNSKCKPIPSSTNTLIPTGTISLLPSHLILEH